MPGGTEISSPSASSYPSFTSLPLEIIRHISSFLDRSDAISLARVCRAYKTFAERQKWQHLPLFLQPYYGDEPLILPGLPGTPEYEAWENAASTSSEAIWREGMRRRTKTVSDCGDQRRWGMVERIGVCPAWGSVHRLVTILEDAAPTLRSLDVFCRKYAHQGTIEYSQTLDWQLQSTPLVFPALTHLHIASGSIQFPAFAGQLCACAPNLLSLNADITLQPDDLLGLPGLSFAPIRENTRIEKLRVAFSFTSFDAERDGLTMVLSLIRHSPRLKQLVLVHDRVEDAEACQPIADAIGVGSGLTDLCWTVDPDIFKKIRLPGSLLPSLRRLVLDCYFWTDTYVLVSGLPHLELLGNILPHAILPPPKAFSPGSASPAKAMISTLAHALRRNAELKAVQRLAGDSDDIFGQIVKGAYTGVIRSFHHGKEELLYLRSWTDCRESCDLPESVTGPDEPRRIKYRSLNREIRVKVFERRDEADWQVYTDLHGLLVPLEVISRMLEVEGIADEDWVGRRMKVENATWQVLLDWKAGILAQPDADVNAIGDLWADADLAPAERRYRGGSWCKYGPSCRPDLTEQRSSAVRRSGTETDGRVAS